MFIQFHIDHVDPDYNISTTTTRIALKYSTDLHGAQTRALTDFGDPVTLPVAPP